MILIGVKKWDIKHAKRNESYKESSVKKNIDIIELYWIYEIIIIKYNKNKILSAEVLSLLL